MLAIRVALAAALASSGCAGALECLSKGHGSTEEECERAHRAPSRSEKAEAKRREAEKADQERRDKENKTRAYQAAKEPCANGDPKACWTVALYISLNDLDPAESVPPLRVACDGKIAQACFDLGIRTNDAARLAMACDFGIVRGCQMAIAKDPSRALPLDSRACELEDGLACERVVVLYEQRRDRVQTTKFLRLACRAGRKPACQRLGEMEIGDR